MPTRCTNEKLPGYGSLSAHRNQTVTDPGHDCLHVGLLVPSAASAGSNQPLDTATPWDTVLHSGHGLRTEAARKKEEEAVGGIQ